MRGAWIFNLITAIFTILGIGVIVFVGVQLATPLPPTPVVELPTVVPTPTASFTFTASFTPTFPPTFTPTPTATPTFTPSSTPSPTPSITRTPGPTFTASQTFTPTATSTATATETPSGPTNTPPPTPVPYPFAPLATRFGTNFSNSLGCAWQGIGGKLLNNQGFEYTPGVGIVQVRVFTTGFEVVTQIGTNSFYGAISGWEVRVADVTNTNTYFVRLESIATGTALSQDVQVTFSGLCTANSAVVDFQSTR